MVKNHCLNILYISPENTVGTLNLWKHIHEQNGHNCRYVTFFSSPKKYGDDICLNLPFDFTNLARTVATYIEETIQLADSMRESTDRLNQNIREGSLKAAANPSQTYIPPDPLSPVPFLNFSPLQNAAVQLQEAARAYRKTLDVVILGEIPSPTLDDLNGLLMQAERLLTSGKGLPGRPWYTHLIYAPGLYTGYGVKTLPAVREAIEQREWEEVDTQTKRTAAAIKSLAKQIQRATQVLKRAVRSG